MTQFNKPSPEQVISAITKRPANKDLVPHLRRMFESSRQRQTDAGVQFDLTFEEYQSMISKGRRRKMQIELNRGNLKRFMEGAKGYVLTPKGRKEFAGRLCNVETFEFTNREKSRRNQHLKRGDTHREDSKQKIAAARTGTKHSDETREKIKIGNLGQTRSDETRANISAAQQGKPKSPEQKEKMSAAASARWAAKRAQQEVHANG